MADDEKKPIPPETRGWLGIPDALWNTIIASIVTLLLGALQILLANRNHTATIDAGTKAVTAAAEAKAVAEESKGAAEKLAVKIQELPEVTSQKVVEKVEERGVK